MTEVVSSLVAGMDACDLVDASDIVDAGIVDGESKNEDFEPHQWRCPSIKYKVLKENQTLSSQHDNYDLSVLKYLTDSFVKNKTEYLQGAP